MTDKSKDEGAYAKASGGQPELDVDALMESVNAHNQAAQESVENADAGTDVNRPSTTEHKQAKTNKT